MRFSLVDAVKAEFPIQRLCGVLGVSQSGYFAWKGRPACRRQREDLVLLAHVRSAFALSNGTYGSPRMTRELQDDGLMVGRRRTARLMRDNGMKARQKRRFRRTTDSRHSWPVPPNIIDYQAELRRHGILISMSGRGDCFDNAMCLATGMLVSWPPFALFDAVEAVLSEEAARRFHKVLLPWKRKEHVAPETCELQYVMDFVRPPYTL